MEDLTTSKGELTFEEIKPAVSSIAIQANDYEIERGCSRLPARRRIIPRKFRDYHESSESEPDDANVEEYIPKKVATPRSKKRGRPSGKSKKAITDIKTQGTAVGSVVGNVQQGRGRPRGSSGLLLPKTHKCSVCDKMFSQKGNLKVHELIHKNKRPFKCDMETCSKAFRTNEALRRHKMAHLGLKAFGCDICNHTFTSNQSLEEHRARHTGERKHQCKVCQRTFRQMSCLRKHLVTHTGLKPFCCDICNKRYSKKEYLRSHGRTHTGEKPFLCQTCGKGFAYPSDLTRHKAVHTGEKNYACSVCDARFSDGSSCRRHVREHDEVRPYNCHLCEETFKRAGNLRAHLSRKHNKGNEDSSALQNLQYLLLASQQQKAQNQFQVESTGSVDKIQLELQKSIVRQLGTKGISSQDESTGTVDQVKLKLQKSIVRQLVGTKGIGSQDDGIIRQIQKNPKKSPRKSSGVVVKLKSSSEKSVVEETPVSDSSFIEIYQVYREGSTADVRAVPTNHPVLLRLIQPDFNNVSLEETPSTDNMAVVSEQIETVTNSVDDPATDIEAKSQDDHLLDFIEKPDGDVVTDHTEDTIEVPSTNTEHNAISGDPQDDDTAISDKILITETEDNTSNTKTVTPDYIASPDFSSQDYYNWLANFTELCKLVPMPIDVDLFQKISQVQKSVSDVLATPSGVLSNKDNFKILMGISKDLSSVTNEHLSYVLANMEASKVDKQV